MAETNGSNSNQRDNAMEREALAALGRAGKGSGDQDDPAHPIVQIANGIIHQAIVDGASQIHVEPGANEVVIRFQIGSTMREVMKLPNHVHQNLVARYKRIADMNIAEQRVPQDGRIGVRDAGRDYDLLVHSEPTPDGERLMMALLARQ